MEDVKKGNKGLIILVIVLLLACIGMGGYIGYDKFFNKDVKEDKKVTETKKTEDVSKNTTTEEDIFKDDTIKPLYFETKQADNIKLILTLVPTSDESGYFSLRYVAIYDTGSEAPIKDGYYKIKDSKLVLSIMSDEIPTGGRELDIYEDLGANFVTDSESPNYKKYSTNYNTKELTIGNKTFYIVK